MRGRVLVAPSNDAVRPTSDRVRQSVFNILEHGIEGVALDGARVLDLFSGTGALGLEAVSRGARYCLFIEQDATARALIRRNVETFALTGMTRIWRRDATDLGPAGNMEAFSFAFLDPPYGQGLGDRALASLTAGKWLAEGAVIVLEERTGTDVTLPEPIVELDRRTWGDTDVRFLRYGGSVGG